MGSKGGEYKCRPALAHLVQMATCQAMQTTQVREPPPMSTLLQPDQRRVKLVEPEEDSFLSSEGDTSCAPEAEHSTSNQPLLISDMLYRPCYSHCSERQVLMGKVFEQVVRPVVVVNRGGGDGHNGDDDVDVGDRNRNNCIIRFVMGASVEVVAVGGRGGGCSSCSLNRFNGNSYSGINISSSSSSVKMFLTITNVAFTASVYTPQVIYRRSNNLKHPSNSNHFKTHTTVKFQQGTRVNY